MSLEEKWERLHEGNLYDLYKNREISGVELEAFREADDIEEFRRLVEEKQEMERAYKERQRKHSRYQLKSH